MQGVPWRVHLMAGEGVLGCVAFGNQRAIELLDGDTVRGEHRALIGSPIGHDGRALLAQPDGHAAWVWILQHALEREEAAAGNDRGPDLLAAIPAIHAAVRVKNSGEQFVHPASPSDFRLSIRSRWLLQPRRV